MSKLLQADSLAIEQAALNYIEGYYEGNVERMKKAVHPDLAKRIVQTKPDSASILHHMTAEKLIEITSKGDGKRIPRERRQKDIRILDIFQNAASVKVVAGDWIDYLHVARFNGEWVIINVLWEMKPRENRT